MKWLKVIVLTILLGTILGSCAYFNTFHNTKKLYSEAKKARKERRGDRPSAQEIKKYDETIEKASKILEVYPTSKYVDDAVFILGECFYYKEDYVRAHRKFQELITYFPESDYYNRARLWLAKCNLQMEDYSSSKIILTELLNTDKLDDDVRDESRLLLGENYYKQELYSEAEQEFQKAAETAKSDENKAHAFLELGKCRLVNKDYKKAVHDFEQAIEYSPDSDFEFDARLNYARSLKLAKEFRTAKQICNELLENTFYEEKHGEVHLELADCIYHEGRALFDQLKGADLQYRGKIEEAIDEYRYITIEYKSTEASGKAYYQIAKIYLEEFGDFAAAKKNFELARNEFRNAEWAQEASAMARDLDELIKLNNMVKEAQGEQLIADAGQSYRLTDLQSLLLEYGNHPELRFMEQRARMQAANGADSSAANGESDLDQLVANKLQLAEVYLFQFGQVDSALQEYEEVIELFPEHPAAAKALYSSAFIYENEFHDKAKTDSLLSVLVRRFSDTRQARHARVKLGLPAQRGKEEIVAELYHEAESRLFNRDDLNGALDKYRALVETYPNSEYAPKSLFAMGWIHERMRSDNETAIQLYRELMEKYPQSTFTSAISNKIRTLETETSSDSASVQMKEELLKSQESLQQSQTSDTTSTEVPEAKPSLYDSEQDIPQEQLEGEKPPPADEEKPQPIP